MAGDAAFPYITCMTLFFSLLLAFHFAMAVPEHSFSTLTSTKDGTKKRNTMVAATSAREVRRTTQNFQTPKKTAENTHVPNDLLKGPKRGRSQVPRTPFQWKNKIFNASKHEVPSGPNPISNRIDLSARIQSMRSLIPECSSVPIIVMKLNHTYQSFEHQDMCK